MWMGGKVPLGYDVRDRKLVVNEAEAAWVRRVFELFAEDRLWSGDGAAAAGRGPDQHVGPAVEPGDV